MKKISITILAFLCFQLWGSAHHEGLVSSINLGTRFSSVLQRRGVIFYNDYQFDPILAVFLFNDRLEYLGDSIGFRDFIFEDKIRLRSRFVSISDKPLFPNNHVIYRASPHRKDTYEWSNSLEMFFPGYNKNYKSELDLTFAKDIAQTHGHYVEVLFKIKFASLNPFGTELEPNLFSSLGWGDGFHNQYFYGSDVKKSGINNWSKGIWVALPYESDRFYPIIQLTHFEVLAPFQNGKSAKGRNHGVLLSFIATVGLLDN